MHVEGGKEEGPVLVAETATAASFRKFGRLVGIGEDGASYAHARTQVLRAELHKQTNARAAASTAVLVLSCTLQYSILYCATTGGIT